MRNCKFKVGDKVRVTMPGGMGPKEIYTGYIIKIDEEGSFWKRIEPRYSVKTDDGKMLGYIHQSYIEPI